MRRILIAAGVLAAFGALSACNPPAKQATAPCNCRGSVAGTDSGAENQVPPAGAEQQSVQADNGEDYAPSQRSTGSASRYAHHGARGYAGVHREHRGYREYHGIRYGSNEERSFHYGHGYRHHHYQHGYQGSDEDYAGDWSSMRVAMSSYEYRSTSRVYHGVAYSHGDYTSGGAYESGGYVDAPEHYESGWEDGYGRMHRGTSLSRHEYAARMDPWHGYDVDCPDGDHHHRYHHRRY